MQPYQKFLDLSDWKMPLVSTLFHLESAISDALTHKNEDENVSGDVLANLVRRQNWLEAAEEAQKRLETTEDEQESMAITWCQAMAELQAFVAINWTGVEGIEEEENEDQDALVLDGESVECCAKETTRLRRVREAFQKSSIYQHHWVRRSMALLLFHE